MKAIWKGNVIAESNKTIKIEGNHYFPTGSIKKKFIEDSDTHTLCHWKGTASYYNIVVVQDTNKNAARYYPDPTKLAQSIKGYIAFWKDAEIVER